MFQYNPGTVTQLSPLNGVTVDVPTLTWEPQAGAVEYLVRIVGGGRTREFTTHSYSFTLTGKIKLIAGDYQWTVQAVDENGHSLHCPSLETRPSRCRGRCRPGERL